MPTKQSNIPNRKELEKNYSEKTPAYELILNKLQETLKREFEQMEIHPTIKSRVKAFDSYYEKILRLLSKLENHKEAFHIYDVIGLRIVCPFLDDLQIAEKHINQKYDVVQIECKGSEHSFREFGYKSTHFLINVPKRMLGQCKIEEPLLCEIQLRTILQDAWSEVEHELIYKTDFSPFDEPMKRKLAALNANLTLSDTLFQEIRDYQRKLQMELNKRRESFIREVHKPAADAGLTIGQGPAFSDSNAKKNQGAKEYDPMGRSIDDLLVDALVAHNAGQFKQAIVIYSSILERDFPGHIKSIIHIHRGMAFFAQSQYKQALKDFTVSLGLSPDNHRAFFYRGLTHEAEQNHLSALEDFDACIEINPYQFEPFYRRAQLYTQMKDYKKAMTDCNLALKIDPVSPKAKQLKKNLKAYMRSDKQTVDVTEQQGRSDKAG